ncbi:CsbD family protein [Chromobacterium sphagni]|uniref:CsbD family protein n=1 Tax=Chromobacterium sphagni TaxID=1903179 RepID=UPI0009F226D1|nr:CsbD family protein [Chromobacterium sphagni]
MVNFISHTQSSSIGLPLPRPTSHSEKIAGKTGTDKTSGKPSISGAKNQLSLHADSADQTMSQAESSTNFSAYDMIAANQIQAAWEQYIGNSQKFWDLLTENELLETEGDLLKLTELVQQRYDITHQVAERQVRSILDQSILIFQLQKMYQKNT